MRTGSRPDHNRPRGIDGPYPAEGCAQRSPAEHSRLDTTDRFAVHRRNYEYRPVLRDFNNWAPFVKVGGVVAFHDVGADYDGPKRVVAEKLRYPSFAPVELVERLAWGEELVELKRSS